MNNKFKRITALESLALSLEEALRPVYSINAHFQGNELIYTYSKDKELKPFTSLQDLKHYHKFHKNGYTIVTIIFKTRQEVELYNEWKRNGLIK